MLIILMPCQKFAHLKHKEVVDFKDIFLNLEENRNLASQSNLFP